MRETERGQLLIIVALGMVVLLGFVALAVDLGHAYTKRRLAQNAADASATAGLRLVRLSDPSTPGSVIHAEIQRVALLNGRAQVGDDDAEFVDLNGDSLGPVKSYAGSLDDVAGVRVRTYISYDTFLASILSMPRMTSAARATAMSMEVAATSTTGLRPIAIPVGSYDVGQEYTIWDDSREAPGNAGWLTFDGSGNAPDLANALANGFPYPGSGGFHYWDDGPTAGDYHSDSPELPIPSWVQGNSGLSNSSSVRSAIIDLMNNQTPIAVLLYDRLEGTGSNTHYHATRLAAFVITAVDLTGHPKTVKGKFIRWVARAYSSGSYTTHWFSTVKLVPE